MNPSWEYTWQWNPGGPCISITASLWRPLFCRLLCAVDDGYVFMSLGIPAIFVTANQKLIFRFEPDDYPLIMKALDALGYGGIVDE